MFAALLTTEDRVDSACRSYVCGWIDVDELERKVDDVIGLTHARWELERLRRPSWRRRIRQVIG